MLVGCRVRDLENGLLGVSLCPLVQLVMASRVEICWSCEECDYLDCPDILGIFESEKVFKIATFPTQKSTKCLPLYG